MGINQNLIMVLMVFLLNFIFPKECAKATNDDENRPYEFGFTIDGQQHRHERKDANGIIQGEFGFITADGVYHVTAYATDENGKFKILSMRNVKLSGPLDGSQGDSPSPKPFPTSRPIDSTTSQPIKVNVNVVGTTGNILAATTVSSVPKPVTIQNVQNVQIANVGAAPASTKKPNSFTTQPTIKPACAGCGYVTRASTTTIKPGSTLGYSNVQTKPVIDVSQQGGVITPLNPTIGVQSTSSIQPPIHVGLEGDKNVNIPDATGSNVPGQSHNVQTSSNQNQNGPNAVSTSHVGLGGNVQGNIRPNKQESFNIQNLPGSNQGVNQVGLTGGEREGNQNVNMQGTIRPNIQGESVGSHKDQNLFGSNQGQTRPNQISPSQVGLEVNEQGNVGLNVQGQTHNVQTGLNRDQTLFGSDQGQNRPNQISSTQPVPGTQTPNVHGQTHNVQTGSNRDQSLFASDQGQSRPNQIGSAQPVPGNQIPNVQGQTHNVQTDSNRDQSLFGSNQGQNIPNQIGSTQLVPGNQIPNVQGQTHNVQTGSNRDQSLFGSNQGQNRPNQIGSTQSVPGNQIPIVQGQTHNVQTGSNRDQSLFGSNQGQNIPNQIGSTQFVSRNQTSNSQSFNKQTGVGQNTPTSPSSSIQTSLGNQNKLETPILNTPTGNNVNNQHISKPHTIVDDIKIENNAILVPNNPPIPIQDKYPGMQDGLPPGISSQDISDILYKFNYTVGFHGHYEMGWKNGTKVGGYYVNGRDGISRVVTYVADELGYRPKFKLVNLGLDSPLTPKEDTEKSFGLQSFEFVWYPLK